MLYDTIIIGAGQAGLSVGYYLKKTNKKFVILDKGSKIGESWRDRYDSLTLFTPRMYCSLPEMEMEGEIHGFPNKDEIAAYLNSYANKYELPIKLNKEIIHVTKEDGLFIVKTRLEEFTAKNLVIATGPFQSPHIPSLAKCLSPNIYQIHSSEYKNPQQLTNGNVLVVGAGNSGAQIAVELSKERDVYLAHSNKLIFLPLIIGKRSIFWWFDKLGILRANNTSFLGKLIQSKGDPIFGLELKEAIKKRQITAKAKVISTNQDRIIFEDSSSIEVNNIIWATGFRISLPWLQFDYLYDNEGKIVHERGITSEKGLYFIGLPWQFRRGSALLQGVGYDAQYIIKHIMKNS
ncbi:oxidoreductase [Niallia circulans]|uniref:Oxidoreductase n=1 Tax=Niallia circulans TaxID=1397 RepID=A0A553SRP6_NIACI|nr:NAD(P)/FAD-dependent oxidoreductase [Niallia circulans]TRZ39675.1 oxidoreductase [Niallia circulans]